MNNYGKAIKIIRTTKDWSQEDLATAIGKSSGYISRIENGERVPSIKIINEMCSAMEVPFYLFALLSTNKKDLGKAESKDVSTIAENLLNILLDGGHANSKPAK